jgi:hypothetical protein
MKKHLFLVMLLLGQNFMFADDTATPITIPVFNPDSDGFFAAEFQHSLSKSPNFFFFDVYGDLFDVSPELRDSVKKNDSSSGGVVRLASSIGVMYPVWDYVSLIGGISFVMESVHIAQSMNLYAGGGAYAHYDPLGLEFGVFAGYYHNAYKELELGDDGYYTGIIDQIDPTKTNAVRFIMGPQLSLKEKTSFLDNVGGLFNFSERADLTSLLAKIAFKQFQLWALKVGIDVYYTQNNYNMFLKQNLFGARFNTQYLLIDGGYRQFEDNSGRSFMSNYKDGPYGRIVVKLNNILNMGVPIMVSYGFEQVFEMKHFFGLGVSFAPDNSWINDYLYEFSGVDNMRIIGSNYTRLK